MDIKNYSLDELIELCEKIRSRILEVVSTNGGHLSSNIGAVELIVAMHFVFDAKNDPFIFDVSHQSYAHKLLSDRWDSFESLRKFGGISGYTKPSESEFDYFIAGHSSTSISLALGAAKAIKLKNEDRIPIAFIGDGSMSGGIAYEAMNELGDLRLPCIILLNDNKMSISNPDKTKDLPSCRYLPRKVRTLRKMKNPKRISSKILSEDSSHETCFCTAYKS